MRTSLRATVTPVILALLPIASCTPTSPTAATRTPTTATTLADGEHYCEEWIWRHRKHACLGEMPAADAAHRRSYVKLLAKGGRVVRVEYRVGAGGWAPDPDGDVGFDVVYDGDTTTALWINRWGKVTARDELSGLRTRWVRPWGAPRRASKEDAYVMEHLQDARGFVVAERWLDESGKPATRRGIHETRFVRDDEGHTLERTYFDVNGAPTANESGAHRERDRYGKRGCNVEWETFDVAGRPYKGALGVSRGLRTCDEYGNALSMRWVDESGAPTVNRQGIRGWDAAYDEHGSRRRLVNVGLDGRPAPAQANESITRIDYDARGYAIAWSYFGPNEEPFTQPDRSSGHRVALLDNGTVIKTTYVDSNGHPVVIDSGYAERRGRYDAEGHLVATNYVGVDGRPARAQYGQAMETFEYDAHDQWKSTTYRDGDGRPMMSREGFATVRLIRDDEGRIVARKHFDTEGAPVQVASAKTMLFTYSGSTAKRPAAITKQEAERRAKEALQRLAAKEPWLAVAKRLGEDASDQPTFGGPGAWYTPLWTALQTIKPGSPPVLVDTERGFFIVLREE